MHQIKIEKFEGPLDLLLQLIEQQQLDITQVALSQVTDQYLEYLRRMEERQPTELADFLVVAAKLLVIKSRALLPYLTWEEEEEGEDLEKQLKMYRIFVEASKNIEGLLKKRHFSFFRPKPPVTEEIIFSPPKKLTKNEMAKIFKEIISKLQPVVALPQEALRKAISIKERIEKIRNLIVQKGICTFDEIISGQCTKAETIVNFLALLELVKQREVLVDQEGLFNQIQFKKY